MANIASGLEVHPARIRQRVDDELPFMATEETHRARRAAGGDRQDAHEVIRRHSIAAARALKDGAPRNDCSTGSPPTRRSGCPLDRPARGARSARFVGRAPEQVDEFSRGRRSAPRAAAPHELGDEEVRV